MKDSFKAAAKVMVKEKMTIIKQNYNLITFLFNSIEKENKRRKPCRLFKNVIYFLFYFFFISEKK